MDNTLRLEQYNTSYKKLWDTFLDHSKNGHFFFKRDYLEYHSDRFEDISLLIFDNKNSLIALLPANIRDKTLFSHQGLTFGGFIISNSMKTEIMLDIFKSLKLFCIQKDIKRIVYKCSPHFYHSKPSEEDLYALFINNFNLIRRDLCATINLSDKIKFRKGRKSLVKKAIKNELIFEKIFDYASYWELLENVLKKYHNVKPVHSLDEIIKLSDIFPNNIKLYAAKRKGEILAGALIFENKQIVHTQYLANSDVGRELGALDLVIDRLLNETYINKKYFSFGTSLDSTGKLLNFGLLSQKEGFGARAFTHDSYELII